jgi:hypothetical protein
MGCMRLRAIAVLTVALGLAAAPAATGEPTPSQKLFRDTLVKDKRTTAEVRQMLRTHSGFVDPRSGFADVTGDGRQDALVLVTTGGAAGTVALYVLSTHGQSGDTKLRAIFRLQRLHRATLRLRDTTVTVVQPRWKPGEDLCCPVKLRERDYAFAPARRTFVRKAERVVDGPGQDTGGGTEP